MLEINEDGRHAPKQKLTAIMDKKNFPTISYRSESASSATWRYAAYIRVLAKKLVQMLEITS